MQHERVQDDDVPAAAGILDNLEHHAVRVFGAIHEAGYARIPVVFRMQIANVGMGLEKLAHICAPRFRRGRVRLEPFVHKAMRSTQDQRAAAARAKAR